MNVSSLSACLGCVNIFFGIDTYIFIDTLLLPYLAQYYPEQSSGGSLSYFETVVTNGDVTKATVMGLLPFTNYDCYVTANTSVGEGPPFGTLTQRTVESGMCTSVPDKKL